MAVKNPRKDSMVLSFPTQSRRAPRHFLDDDRLATAAIDAPHRVKQKNQESPERNELETALGELIVTGRRLMAA